MRHVIIALSLVLLAAAGCADYSNKQPLGRDYGNTQTHNFATQIINPAPVYEGREVPDLAGTRAAGAIERYDTGAVLKPEILEIE